MTDARHGAYITLFGLYFIVMLATTLIFEKTPVSELFGRKKLAGEH